jgi:hypothetical protein
MTLTNNIYETAMESKKRNWQITPPPTAKTIETATTCCWLDDSGIAIFIAEGTQTIENAKENMAVCRQLTSGKKTPVLLDFSNLTSMTREARAYYASEESSSIVSAVAIVTTSVISKLIGNFFIGLNKAAEAPVKIFTNVNEAKGWLRQFIEKSN